MPELPEVETVKRGLAPALLGARFERVEQRRKDLRFPLPPRFAARLTGRFIEALERRAKYILARLDDGATLSMHLGMTGRFTVSQHGNGAEADLLGHYVYETPGDPAHDHVVFHMSGGAVVTYNDARRFGYMDLIEPGGLATHPHFKDLGIEPLSDALTPQALAALAEGRRTDLKAFLLDQRVIAGLGNIYVCEVLFRAALSPERHAATLRKGNGAPAASAARLVKAIRSVLGEALEAGGSTLRDYRQADGSAGRFQERFDVYDREGEPCQRRACSGTIARLSRSGRSTFYCPRCQR